MEWQPMEWQPMEWQPMEWQPMERLPVRWLLVRWLLVRWLLVRWCCGWLEKQPVAGFGEHPGDPVAVAGGSGIQPAVYRRMPGKWVRQMKMGAEAVTGTCEA